MSRPLRLNFSGATYHLTARGNEQQNIYRDDQDRETFLDMLAECVRRFGWIITAYVLMSNHFHLVIELTRPTLSQGLKWLNGTYSQRFNRRHKRVGHLFQGRPNTPLIEAETYLLNVLRYVVLNPVRAGMVARAEDYAWSSYRSTAGLAPAPEWLSVDRVLALFAPARDAATHLYRDFVRAGVGLPWSPFDDVVGQVYLGSPQWLEQIKLKVSERPRDSEHPKQQRVVGERPIADVITAVASTLSIEEARIRRSHGGVPRMLTAWLASYEEQMTLLKIASGLRVRSAGQVSKLIRACDDELDRNPALQALRDRCLATLRGEEKSIEGKT